MDYKDYYAVLGVPRTASQKEIKKAFRKLAREHHPDTKGGDAAAEVRFKEVNEANAVLSDPDKRALYDRLGADWQSYARAGAGAPAGAGARAGGAGGPIRRLQRVRWAPAGNVRYEFHTTGDAGEFSDFFNAFFAGDSEPLEHARPRPASRPAARPSRTSSPGWASVPTAARATTRGRRHDHGTAAPTATRVRRGHGRDHARGGLPRHEPPRRGRGQAPRGHDPARRRHRHPHPIDRQGARRRRPARRRPPDVRTRCSRGGARTWSASCR